jgi:Tfp pilus assembly protein PilF
MEHKTFRKNIWALIILILVIGVMSSIVSSEEPDGSPQTQKPNPEAADKFKLLPSDAEKQLVGDNTALAALKHTKAVKLTREYFRDGDINKLYIALNTAGEAVKLDPYTSRYWATLGTVHSELARFNIFRSDEYAQDAFRQALELAPTDASVMVLIAVNLAKTGECEEALEYFEKAVKTNILLLSADIAQWMNVCYLTDAQTNRGIVFYYNIQKQHPRYYYIGLYRSVLYKAHFDYKSARSELTHILNRRDIDGATKNMARRLLEDISREEGSN